MHEIKNAFLGVKFSFNFYCQQNVLSGLENGLKRNKLMQLEFIQVDP